jgi:hypothetical protein
MTDQRNLNLSHGLSVATNVSRTRNLFFGIRSKKRIIPLTEVLS